MQQRRTLLTRVTVAIGAAAIALGATAMAFAVHDEGFQLEGNATAANLHYVDIDDINPGNPVDTVLTPGDLTGVYAGDFDWDSLFDNGGPGGTGREKALPAGFTGSDFVVDFKFSGTTFITSDDTTFATGSSDVLDITGWQCNQDNNVNSKADIINGYAALDEGSGDQILYFGLEKDVDNGTNNVGLWLFQDPEVGCASTGSAVDFTGVHLPGDLFIVSAFTNGGGVANITAYQWTDDLDGDGTADDPGLDPNPVDDLVNGDCLDSAANDRLCAVVNGESITMPWRTADAGVIDAPKVSPNFFEGGINLDAFPQFANSCYTGFMLATRSSQSLTANLFDYVLGNIDTCHPELSLDKEPETQTSNVGDAFNWTLAVANTGTGPADDAVVSDTIPAGLTITGTPTVAPVSAGTCSVLGQDITCTLDIAAGASATITIPVQSTTAVFAVGSPACVTVNNTGTVSVDGDTNPGDDSDTVAATICRPIVSKTAAGSYTHDVQWTIDKSVDIDQHTLLAGENENSTYTVTVTKTVQDSGFAVSGTISIQNPNPEDSMTVDVTDALSSGQSLAATAISCGAAGDGDDAVIAPSSILICSYTLNPANANAGTNTATATLNGIAFTGSSGYTFTPTNTGEPESITVTDTFDGTPTSLGSASSTTTFTTYQHNFACSTTNGDYTNGHYEYTRANTAKINETIGDEASESVDTDCYLPTITKTAAGSYTHGVDWTITKSVDIDQHTLLAGQDDDSTYTVSVNKTVTDANFAVAGTITVSNPSPEDTMTVDVTDQLSSGQSAAATVISCGVAGDGDDALIPAGGSISCTYSIATANANAGNNTATATFSSNAAVSVSDSKGYAFTATNTGEPETVTVKDNFNGAETTLGTASDDKTFSTYKHNFACSTDETRYNASGHYGFTRDNTATIVETGDNDSESVDTDCYIPTITKSADGSFDRDWDWTIRKSADASNLTLQVGQSYVVNYTVVVDRTKADSEFSVAGSITVANPSPEDAMTVDVTDQLSTGQSLAATAIDCGAAGDGDNASIPAGDQITCTYDFNDLAGIKAGDAGTNTAVATFSADPAVAVSDSDPYSYDLDNETDECITISDTIAGALGTVCADSNPASYTKTYTLDVGRQACGEYDTPNTASFVAKDQDGEGDDTGSASWNVHVSIDCQDGCTLTQGYWKTHSERGPAPYDDTWALLDALEGTGTPLTWAGDGVFDGADELFFSPNTGLSWFRVFWTAPSGNAYYQLAHQYQAAVLNVLNDASAPPSVVDAIAHAETLFESYTPEEIGAMKGNKPVRKDFIVTAGILGSYNMGDIGPGHCDEDGLSSKTP